MKLNYELESYHLSPLKCLKSIFISEIGLKHLEKSQSREKFWRGHLIIAIFHLTPGLGIFSSLCEMAIVSLNKNLGESQKKSHLNNVNNANKSANQNVLNVNRSQVSQLNSIVNVASQTITQNAGSDGAKAPPGFSQTHIDTAKQSSSFGNRCWLNTALQALFANRHFIEITKAPLVKKESESDFDFSLRIDVQKKLIMLINARATGKEDEITKALSQLHEAMCNRDATNQIKRPGEFGQIKQPGEFGNSNFAIRHVADTLNYEFTNMIPDNSFLLFDKANTDTVIVKPVSNANYETTPSLLFLLLDNDISLDMTQITTFDFSLFFNKKYLNGEKKLYRAVGIASDLPGHKIAYTFHQDKWYCCNDSSVTEIKKPPSNIKFDTIVFEPIS